MRRLPTPQDVILERVDDTPGDGDASPTPVVGDVAAASGDDHIQVDIDSPTD